ncbi:succinate dehydrogenase, cytochrome b556 subunit [Amaricoccus sp.]|uniref:succinate dehydrogenase, cytochrome b556 subunit n=1 Tax=Amaricoccus sp. TaxID=1872485 RepID=UPI002625B3F1|nr:succinate dehydrogenase, cytochrome b556 subunit [Amaricoccus sp.]HRO10775.1 succinate dehydrogenase, cytochrome b556 subunit [Amaricoccus sp.]
MSDANRGNRPLSPFMIGPIYRPQINSIMSISHRLTGLGLALTAMLLVWWFLAAATGPEYFRFVDGLLTSWIGTLVMVVSLAALWYHFFTGLRHLVWDAGVGLEKAQIRPSGIAVLVAAGVMTLLTLVIAL